MLSELCHSSEPQSSAASVAVADTLLRANRIATLPSIAIQMIQLCEAPETTIEEVSNVIDPVMSLKILKLVNSAYYGMSSQINSINQAVLMLGLGAVRNIAIALSLIKFAKGGRIGASFHANGLWTHSLAVASAARMLAQRSGVASPDEGFAAGMLHDIGIIVAVQVHPKPFAEMIEALDSNEDLTFCETEVAHLGASHDTVGAALCQQWKFPPNLIYATGYHHRPRETPHKHRVLSALINVSDTIAARLHIGYSRTVASDDLDLNVLSQANVSEADVRFVEANLVDATRKANDALFA